MNLKALGLIVALFGATTAYQPLFAETEHQSIEGEEAKGGGGGSAELEGTLEIKEIEGVTVGRPVASLGQWAYVTYWMGLPTPAGKSTVRLRVYNTAEETSQYVMYIKVADGQKMIGDITVPEGSKPNTFVDIDFIVELDEEWSGIILKKKDKENLPGLWIDSVKVLLE